MKRAMTGGSARGPVAHSRQRATIRLVQLLLLLLAAGLLLFAGYTWGRASGLDAGRSSSGIDEPSRPSAVQVVVLSTLGLIALGGALALQGEGVRIPTPARLEELTARAESTALERARSAASSREGRP